MRAYYELAVLEDYRKKKNGGSLLTNLLHPTPGSLKKECVAVFDRRYDRKDDVTLSSFFEPQSDEQAFRLAIKRCETDRFRPLNMFLKNDGGNPDSKNIELLAWLIDFQPRPYTVWLKVPGNAELKIQPPDPPVPPQPEVPEKIDEPVDLPSHKIRNILIGLALLIIVGGAGYFKWRKPVPPPAQVANAKSTKCMYWTGENYVAVPCGQTHGDTPVVKLDTSKLTHFKKITKQDTLTVNSIRKVWYFKIKGSLEIYTDSGAYPLDTNRRLLPLTKYMFDKYIPHH
jgi:hypothetical protein